jgi:hypothetical protein
MFTFQSIIIHYSTTLKVNHFIKILDRSLQVFKPYYKGLNLQEGLFLKQCIAFCYIKTNDKSLPKEENAQMAMAAAKWKVANVSDLPD